MSGNTVKIWKPVVRRSIRNGTGYLPMKDVIDYCSVSVYSEGTQVPKQTVLDFDVHEPFLEVKKWN
jgi:hypothetical protein